MAEAPGIVAVGFTRDSEVAVYDRSKRILTAHGERAIDHHSVSGEVAAAARGTAAGVVVTRSRGNERQRTCGPEIGCATPHHLDIAIDAIAVPQAVGSSTSNVVAQAVAGPNW